MTEAEKKKFINEFTSVYSSKLSGIVPSYTVRNKPDGEYLVFEMAAPKEHHFKIHNEAVAAASNDNPFKERSTLQRRLEAPKYRLAIPETQVLRSEISQNLTVDDSSFETDFFARYTPSVAGFEQLITSNANFVVYGRRGAGKSSLLAYAMRRARQKNQPYSWIAMQTFASRADNGVIPAVLSAVLYELKNTTLESAEIEELQSEFNRLGEKAPNKSTLQDTDRLIPRMRRLFSKLSSTSAPLTIFLDDIHVLDSDMQPLILAYLYKVCRANKTFMKISGISQLTNLWNSQTQTGIQPPHDAQIMNLDQNLTMPDKSRDHIVSILETHAQYCGLPSIKYLAGDDVLSRLVLVAAGVPRDSLNLFSTAISKALAKNEKLVSITSINASASEMAEEKIKDIDRDSSGDQNAIRGLLAEVREFCVTTERKNSFLVEIKNSDPRYRLMQKLVALRLVHLLHEGITPSAAGKRFIALMLDYGFYVGIRAARSVELIPDKPRSMPAKELRSLPIFR